MSATSSMLGIHPGDELTRGMGPEAVRAEVEARMPEFADVARDNGATGNGAALDHLLDVTCTVSAELGRTKLPLGEVLKFNIGGVLELDRLVSQPVDILVQGVLLARGEVVVVNDRFAIRIQEIVDGKKRS